MYVCVNVGGGACAHMNEGACGVQKMAQEPVKVEREVDVRHLQWVLGPNSGRLQQQYSTTEPPFQAPLSILQNKKTEKK